MALQKRRSKQRKRCFVIQQMGDSGSDKRKHADAVLRNVIRPAARDRGFTARRIDELGRPGMISEEIIEALYSADLVIADLAGLNPNVMYELGVRQAWCLPLIQMAPEVTSLPFDIRDINTVPYGDPTAKGSCRSARAELKRRIAAVEQSVGTPRAFGEMLRNTCEPFQMDAVRRAGHWALRDLIGSLRDRIREVEREIDTASEEAFRHLALLVQAPFNSLRDKRHVLVGIAEDARDKPLAAKLRALTRLGDMGDRVIQMLETEARTSATLRKVQRELESIKERAQELADGMGPDG